MLDIKGDPNWMECPPSAVVIGSAPIGWMQLRCNRCGKPVSTLVPTETIVRAWIECPECIAKGPNDKGQARREQPKT